jgi:hypothetical protein
VLRDCRRTIRRDNVHRSINRTQQRPPLKSKLPGGPQRRDLRPNPRRQRHNLPIHILQRHKRPFDQ